MNSWIFFILLALILIGIESEEVQAKISRGCKGSIEVFDKNQAVPGYKVIDLFDGIAECKNTEPNKCRSRAKDNIFRCADDLWDLRWNLSGDPNDEHPDKGLPGSCSGHDRRYEYRPLYKE